MTALIADTSPVLRNIPSDPPADHSRHSFEFSPSPMPGRYLSEGRNQDPRAPSPRSYNHGKVPAMYAQQYEYPVPGPYAHRNPGAPARITAKPCRCPHQCSCSTLPSAASHHRHHQQQQLNKSESERSMWHKDNGNSNMDKSGERAHLFHDDPSARSIKSGIMAVSVSSAPSRSPSPPAILARQQQRDSSHAMTAIELASSTSSNNTKKSDWENLLGAVDLELRAQERAELVPDSSSTTPVPTHHYAHAISVAHHHHRNSVGNGHNYVQQQHRSAAASVSPEFGPINPAPRHQHHRRGTPGDGDRTISGGGPAHSGSTADAACLLATLPQRMLDRVSQQPAANPVASPAVGPGGGSGGSSGASGVLMSRPALVSAAGPPVTPVRVQASGRRGPRGQSRFKGVCITRAGKWRAVIYIGRKQKYLGVFDSEFDAARAYDAAALQHFAEGAKLNFPDGIERQLNDLSSEGSGRPFVTAGAGGEAALRSSTPPAFLETAAATADTPGSADAVGCVSGKRSRKSAFGEHDDEWVRDTRTWNSSRI